MRGRNEDTSTFGPAVGPAPCANPRGWTLSALPYLGRPDRHHPSTQYSVCSAYQVCLDRQDQNGYASRSVAAGPMEAAETTDKPYPVRSILRLEMVRYTVIPTEKIDGDYDISAAPCSYDGTDPSWWVGPSRSFDPRYW